MNYPHKCQWRGALMFSLICVWINNCEAGDLRRYRTNYDVNVMFSCSPKGINLWDALLIPIKYYTYLLLCDQSEPYTSSLSLYTCNQHSSTPNTSHKLPHYVKTFLQVLITNRRLAVTCMLICIDCTWYINHYYIIRYDIYSKIAIARIGWMFYAIKAHPQVHVLRTP